MVDESIERTSVGLRRASDRRTPSWPRPLAIVVAAAVVVIVTYVGGWLRSDGAGTPVPAGRPVPELAPASTDVGVGIAPQAIAVSSNAELERLIGVFEERILTHPDALNLRFLGDLYLRKAQLVGDVALYERAEEVLEQGLALYPTDLDGQSLVASARLALHDFRGALAMAEGVLAEDPARLGVLAVAGDAYLELGNVEAAKAAFGELSTALGDHPAVVVREAGVAFLEGDLEGAVRLASTAEANADASGLVGAELAFYQAYRADLDYDRGHYAAAATGFESALESDPSFGAAMAGLAEVRAAQGDFDEAIELLEAAIVGAAQPDDLVALGDLYLVSGEPEAAEAMFTQAVAMALTTDSAVWDRLLAKFYADHDRHAGAARHIARHDLAEVRQDVHAYDAYAWALYRNGQLAGARAASDQAVSLATPDAAMWYHAGLISAGLGETDRAIEELTYALDLNPHFHPLLADHASEVLASLEA